MPDRSITALLERLGRIGSAGFTGSRSIALTSAPTHDSRHVAPGGIFVAIRGFRTDGAAYAAEAVERGAALLVAERDLHAVVPTIVVSNTRRALAEIAAWWEGDPAEELLTIGVTGTDGKTTTSTLLATALTSVGLPSGLLTTAITRVGGVQAVVDGSHTTPEAPELQHLLRRIASSGDQAAVIEATSHGLELARVGGMSFAAGLVTNVTVDHLDLHGTVEAYRAAKLRLVDQIRWSAASRAAGLEPLLVLPTGDATEPLFAAAAAAAGVRVAHFGLLPDGRAVINGEPYALELQLPGRYNLVNAAAALTLVAAWGLPLEVARAAVEAEPGPPGRSQRIVDGQPFSIIVDFAHNGHAMRNAVEMARSLCAPGGRLLVVAGAAGERDPRRRPEIGAALAAADRIWITEDHPRSESSDAIAAAIHAGISAVLGVANAAGRTQIIHERRAAIHSALHEARPGDVVLLAGKGHEQTIERNGQVEAWDEVGVVREALAALGYPR